LGVTDGLSGIAGVVATAVAPALKTSDLFGMVPPSGLDFYSTHFSQLLCIVPNANAIVR
jgi:hypothetical protein